MYSENVDKICEVCVYAKSVKGTATHRKCELGGGYVPLSYSCDSFKYDILKKKVRRKPKLEHSFTAEDFKI